MHRRWLWGPLIGSLLLAACQAAGAPSASGPAPAAQQAPAAQAARELKIGDVAPEFALQDQNRKEVRLSQFRGKPVQVAFYVYAFSGG
jgi:cytochrome oxidase Cu insertion factor (SCO1/SenC/PrrC family)